MWSVLEIRRSNDFGILLPQQNAHRERELQGEREPATAAYADSSNSLLESSA